MINIKQSPPKVSVIVPVYNVENYIGRCIESIQKQTLADWELILIDDCSPDNSFGIISRYAETDPRIIVKKHDVNQGPMIARRRGDEIARGKYITYCDGDDELAPNALEVLYHKAITERGDIVVGQIMVVHPDGKKEPFGIHAELNFGNDREAFFKSVLCKEIHQGVAGKMYKKDLVKNAKLTLFENCTMSEDSAVLFQYIDICHKVSVIADYIYYYNQRPDSTTHSPLTVKQIEGICKTTKLRNQLLNKYPQLKRDKDRYFTRNLIGILPNISSKKAYKQLIRSNNLEEFVSTSYILRNFGLLKGIRLLIIRDLYPLVNRIRRVGRTLK